MGGIGAMGRSGGMTSGSSEMHGFEGTTRMGNAQQGTTGNSSFKAKLEQLINELESQEGTQQAGSPQQSDGSTDDLLQRLEQLEQNDATSGKKHGHHNHADAASTMAAGDAPAANGAAPAAL